MRNEPRGEGAWFIDFLRFGLNDEIVLRMIVFIVCGLSSASRFLEIRRIAYESCGPVLTFSVNQSEDAFYVAAR